MRLLIDAPATGSWNMAVDEMLLETSGDRRELTLRIYQWSPATLSLGYFQSHAERERDALLTGLPWVRRPSGGGAIVHDREMTYSLTVPPGHRLIRHSQSLYRCVHEVVVDLLAARGIQATIHESQNRGQTGNEPFLCFQRRAAGDLIIRSSKVVGSAQRKKRGAVLQHGSLLLHSSSAAPMLPGIVDVSGKDLPESLFRVDFPTTLAQRLNETCEASLLSDYEIEYAKRIQADVFEALTWNERR